MKNLILLTAFLNTTPVFATTILQMHGGKCDSERKVLEQVPVFEDHDWSVDIKIKNAYLFMPERVKQLVDTAHVYHTNASSSHIVNNLAEGFKTLQKKEDQLLANGELKKYDYGVTYKLKELEARRDSIARAQVKYFEPILKDMYRVYIEAMERKEKQNELKKDPVTVKKLYELANAQRTVLMDHLTKNNPAILKKLGKIGEVVEGKELPFSYRDGYIVKIRFENPNFTKAVKYDTNITIYPHMLANSLKDEDDYFVKALDRWRSFTLDQWLIADKMKNTPKWQSQAAKLLQYGNLYFNGWIRDEEIIEKEPIMRKAYEKSHRDYHQALYVHGKVSKLTEEEIYSLLDLMRELRMGDIPQCRAQIVNLNKVMAAKLSGLKPGAPQPKAVGEFSRDVIYYQDIYGVFSEAAELKLQK